METTTEYLTTKEASVLAGVTYVTINNWIKRGLIEFSRPTGTKRNRIVKDKFLQFLNTKKNP